GKVWHILAVDLLVLVLAVSLYFTFIPRYGALGAAMAVSVATIVHALAKQAALMRWTSVRWCSWRYAKVYIAAALATGLLTMWQWLATPTLMPGIALVILCWLGVIIASREALVVDQMFPELRRIRYLRRWLQAS
ncbi:MAG: polysaccharide biosynthesis C-terminal domain-containing protein, partial [Proteobacteria bacterium]|nr:polysaccharide biosynthesis C-terminal domain-containing protein [Pseudomonadota bacterium]